MPSQDSTPASESKRNSITASQEMEMEMTKIDNKEFHPNRKEPPSAIMSSGETEEVLATGGERIDAEILKYPQGLELVTIIVALCLAVFLVALDQTIISTAIPKITDRFHSVNDIGWYGSSYLLTKAALQPSFGRIYSVFSIKYTFITAIAIFELGSLICAIAPSSNALIVGRAIAGAGVGGLFTGSIVIVVYCLPLRKRPAALGIISSMWAVASVTGPLLGGVFSDRISWRWCFYINLPIGAFSIIVIAFILDIHRDDNPDHLSLLQRIMKLDLIGASILIPAIICLLLALQWGGTTYPWNSSRIAGLLSGAGCLTIVFVYSQIKLGDKATLPPYLFQNRNTLCAFIFAGFFGAAFFPLAFYLAVYFQSIKGSSAIHAGIQMLPMLIASTVSSTGTGGLISAIGYYTPFMFSCMALFSIGAGLLTTLSITSSFRRAFGYQVLAGLGIGVGFEGGIIVVQTVLPRKSAPVAISCVSFFMTLGGAIFIPICQSLFQNRLLKGIENNAPQLDAHLFLESGATEIRSLLASMNQQGALDIVLQAYLDGVKDTFWVTAACAIAAFVAACGLEWKSVKKEHGKE